MSVEIILPEATLPHPSCAMMHSVVHWPKCGKVSDLLVALRSYIMKMLSQLDVHLVFDRYNNHSINYKTISQLQRSRNLSLSSPLPAKEMAMRIIDTKQQLTEMARNYLIKYIPAKSNKPIITAKLLHQNKYH